MSEYQHQSTNQTYECPKCHTYSPVDFTKEGATCPHCNAQNVGIRDLLKTYTNVFCAYSYGYNTINRLLLKCKASGTMHLSRNSIGNGTKLSNGYYEDRDWGVEDDCYIGDPSLDYSINIGYPQYAAFIVPFYTKSDCEFYCYKHARERLYAHETLFDGQLVISNAGANKALFFVPNEYQEFSVEKRKESYEREMRESARYAEKARLAAERTARVKVKRGAVNVCWIIAIVVSAISFITVWGYNWEFANGQTNARSPSEFVLASQIPVLVSFGLLFLTSTINFNNGRYTNGYYDNKKLTTTMCITGAWAVLHLLVVASIQSKGVFGMLLLSEIISIGVGIIIGFIVKKAWLNR